MKKYVPRWNPLSSSCWKDNMKNLEVIRKRYMQDDLPVRLGGIAANLARIASCALRSEDRQAVQSMLEESEFFIEWTAPEAPLTMQAKLVELQIQIALWYRIWPQAYLDQRERKRLGDQARSWSQDTLMLRGHQVRSSHR
jgi:hypothetical protein